MGETDGSILLSDDSASLPVEIVIGGWGNAFTVIRNGVQGDTIAKEETVGIMSTDVPQYFWISWTSTQVKLGRVCGRAKHLFWFWFWFWFLAVGFVVFRLELHCIFCGYTGHI